MTKYYIQADDNTIEVDLTERGEMLVAIIGDSEVLVDLKQISGSALHSLIIDNHSYEVFVEDQGDECDVLLDGELYRLGVQDEWARRLANIQRKSRVAEGDLEVKAPMPGLVLDVEVEVGQRVARGDGLLVLSAMKMENQIKAPRAGVVKEIKTEAGQSVEQGRVLVILGPAVETPAESNPEGEPQQ